jgi:hypothetical protein
MWKCLGNDKYELKEIIALWAHEFLPAYLIGTRIMFKALEIIFI